MAALAERKGDGDERVDVACGADGGEEDACDGEMEK